MAADNKWIEQELDLKKMPKDIIILQNKIHHPTNSLIEGPYGIRVFWEKKLEYKIEST